MSRRKSGLADVLARKLCGRLPIENSRAVIFQGPGRLSATDGAPRTVYDPYYAKQTRGTYRLLRIAHVSVPMPRPFIRTKRIYPRPNCRAMRTAAFPFSSTASVHGENARTPCGWQSFRELCAPKTCFICIYINYKLCNVHKNLILKEAVESSRKILINRVEKRKKEKYRFRKQEKKISYLVGKLATGIMEPLGLRGGTGCPFDKEHNRGFH